MVRFCIRDDDTSFFTSPDDLEQAYGSITRDGPVSLAVVPFHRAGTSKGVPERFRGRWSVHALHENRALVDYLRLGVAAGRYEIMLHGYHHDERDGRREFQDGSDLRTRVTNGRRYLEDVLGCAVRVFVPPHNAIGRAGLRAIAADGLHLGGTAGVRSGWPPLSTRTWSLWARLRRWNRQGGVGVPWVLDLKDHREIAGMPVTPLSRMAESEAALQCAMRVNGVFCAATHYWELGSPSLRSGEPSVGEQLRRLTHVARTTDTVTWRTVGDAVLNGPTLD
jgi:hypothetical protein